MEIVRIFDGDDTFWCASYPEDEGVDIFSILCSQWSDTEYLDEFFNYNKEDLFTSYWNGLNIDTAITLVQEEAYWLEGKLLCIAFKEPDCNGTKIDDIFTLLNRNEFILKRNADIFVKGKLDSLPQMLRLYGIRLEDGTIIITGGAIKICKGMDRDHLRSELKRLERVYNYLKEQQIYNVKGLIE